MNDKLYTCDRCGKQFFSTWTDEEAAEESKELFGQPIPEQRKAIVCDQCHEELMKEHFPDRTV